VEYTKEQIHHFHQRIQHVLGLDIQEYITDLETRLTTAQQGEELQNGASGCNKLGEDITLYLPDEEGLDPSVVWHGCAGYDAMSFYVESPDEARALYYALIAIKDVEAD